MDTFFCAQESEQAQEDLIGTAGTAEIYVLVECPPPWTSNALNSKSIPANLRALVAEIDETELPVYLFLIYSDRPHAEGYTRCLIFHQKPGFSNGYSQKEFSVPNISDVAPALQDYLAGKLSYENTENPTRDILVCTHGSRDKCCAKYGNILYRQALATVSDLSLEQVRIWQVSHFGGHRYAPTIADFPEGRYYGRLDQESFTSILTKTGDINSLSRVYRGWGILPWAAQILERELIIKYGWDWFSYSVAAQILEQNEDESFNSVQLSFIKPDGVVGVYQAEVVQDKNQVLYLRGSCNNEEASETAQYIVKNLARIQH